MGGVMNDKELGKVIRRFEKHMKEQAELNSSFNGRIQANQNNDRTDRMNEKLEEKADKEEFLQIKYAIYVLAVSIIAVAIMAVL